MSVRCLFSTAAPGRRIDIFGAVVLTRFPIIAPAMSEIEKRFSDQVLQVEAENSLRSNHELRSTQDKKLLARKEQLEKEGKDLSELEGELSFTAEMQEDEWMKRAAEIRAKYNLGESKHSEDPNSIRRCLDRKLILVVKQKLQNRSDDYRTPWIVPQRKNEGETLRETVEKCVEDLFVGNNKVTVMGSAPFATYRHKYPKKLRDATNADEAQIFFFDAEIQGLKEPSLNKSNVSEYMWCTPEEFRKTVAKREYRGVISSALFE
ncbi:hypothetical protein L596_008374 [Steinernema carpocapsae]|uniref:Large ribosomal subunit protein mL46 N-terminal domain-containing protein n=1 Tax=Steinernema carpocapsae TaxID=34508 RepID=A0A4U5PCF3_STECR|nr:hypothetical protein L596_008374 [Steinernema carpocapsae]